jgi:hypothetical protein
MKRLISIPILVLILFSGININIASHYCGGKLAATKLSFSGELASCGMEEHSALNIPNGSISRHCCDNVVTSISVALNYAPSVIICLPDNGPELNHLYIVPGNLYKIQENLLPGSYYITRPPGGFNPYDVEQQTICIFRI